jgi:hypothetical protein
MSDEKQPMEAAPEGAPAEVPPLWPVFAYLGVTICSAVAAYESFHMRSALGWAVGAAVCFVIARLGTRDQTFVATSQPDLVAVAPTGGADEFPSQRIPAGAKPPADEPTERSVETSNPGPVLRWFAKFLAGDFGLAKTYWLFGVLGGLAWGLLMGALIAATQSMMMAITCAYFTFFFLLFVSGATWDAATRYKGNPVWAILAKLSVVASMLGYFIDLHSLL